LNLIYIYIHEYIHINTARKYYNKLISKTKNKTKNTRRIIKKEIGDKNCQNDIKYLKIYDAVTNIHRKLATFLINIS